MTQDDENDLKKLYEFSQGLKNVQKREILPYHTLGLSKWENLGIEYQLKNVPVPTFEQITSAKKIFEK